MRGPAAVVALAFGLMAPACNEDLLNPMARQQPKTLPFATSSFWDDGLSMRPPPAATVAREHRPSPLQQGTMTTRGARPGENGQVEPRWVERIPVPVTRALVTKGRARFEIFCAACHGLVGDGDSIVARQMALRPPPSLHKYGDRPPGYLFEVITEGFGLMPRYAEELDPDERWAVVAYVQALQLSRVPLSAAPPAVRAQLQKEARRER